MKVLVCGGRRFTNAPLLSSIMDALHAERRISVLIHGDATGADHLAHNWAQCYGVSVRPFPARWRKDGSIDLSAGPRRNSQMLAEGKPDVVVAFPGGRGTADMVRRAKAAGIEVIEVTT